MSYKVKFCQSMTLYLFGSAGIQRGINKVLDLVININSSHGAPTFGFTRFRTYSSKRASGRAGEKADAFSL
jgi:hypothetical protein